MLKLVFKDNNEMISRFHKLDAYFEGVTEEDLLSQDIEDYIEFAEPKDKGLMQVFVTKYLSKHLETLNRSKVKSLNLGEMFYNGDSLHGCGKVVPANMGFVGKPTIKDLVEMICPLKEVRLIDLSNNFLGDTDLDYIVHLVSKLELDGKLKETVVNLKNNKIHGWDNMKATVCKLLNQLVQLQNVKFVVMVYTPFCTSDQKDFFMKIGTPTHDDCLPCTEITSKLIWIDWVNIFNDGWQHLLTNSLDLALFPPNLELVRRIQITHLQYYEPENLYTTCQNEEVHVSRNKSLFGLPSDSCCIYCGNLLGKLPKNNHHVLLHDGQKYLALASGQDIHAFAIRDWKTGRVVG